jgi:hypothetical protein
MKIQQAQARIPIRTTTTSRQEIEDDKIMRALARPGEMPGEENGTDETLNEANSALSDTPSNGKQPKHFAVSN